MRGHTFVPTDEEAVSTVVPLPAFRETEPSHHWVLQAPERLLQTCSLLGFMALAAAGKNTQPLDP